MMLSKHANHRKQKRAIRKEVVSIIEKFGDIKPAVGNVYKVFLCKKDKMKLSSELRRVLNILEKSRANTLIISSDDRIITLY